MYSSIKLTTEDIEILKDLVEQFTVYPSTSPDLFCKQARDFSLFVPKKIKQALTAFAKNGTPSGFFLIEGLPIVMDYNLFPETPPNNTYTIGETTLIARIQAILIHTIAEMITYEAEGCGQLFQDVVPTSSMAIEQTSLSSNVELEIHTEQAFSKVKPDIISLACIRGDLNAFTYILPVQILLNQLTNDEKNLLREPLWKIGVDLSFKMFGEDFMEGNVRGPLAILSGTEENPVLVFDQDLMYGITEEAREMIKKIVEIYHAYKISHCLRPGQMIIIDNRCAVHGRSAFYPIYDGYDRFLVRCFAVFDYERTSYARKNTDNSRMVCAYYS